MGVDSLLRWKFDNENTASDSKGDDVQDVDFEEVKEE